MNYVYLVIEDYATDYESGKEIEAYSTLEKAQKRVKEKIKDFKKLDVSYDVEIEEPYYYEGYESGYYIKNHTSIYIQKMEVE